MDSELFEWLVSNGGRHLISIGIPTHSKGREVSQDRIRLKNQLAEVDSALDSRGVRRRDRDELLSDARDLLEDVEFWEHQSDMLAVYVDDDGETHPVSVSEATTTVPSLVSDHFYLRYVLSEIDPLRLPVLVLTRGAVQLYELAGDRLARIAADLPESFDDVNWFVDRESQLQQHSDRAGSQGVHHGHEPSADRAADTNRFLRAVGDAISALHIDSPLVVLGDDPLVKRFGAIYSDDFLSPENSGISRLEEARVVELARPVFDEHRAKLEEQVVREALDALGRGMATSEVEEALADAAAGRIEKVVLYRDADPIWAAESGNDLTPQDERGHDSVDMIDRLAVRALTTGAKVTVVSTPIAGQQFVAVRRF